MSVQREVIGDCTLYCGDAMAILPDLPPCDVLLTDPPYGKPGGARHGEYQKPNAKWKNPPRRTAGYSLPEKVNQPAAVEWIAMALVLSRWAIIWGGNHFPLPPQAAWLVWDKYTVGNLSDCELAWTNLARDSIRQFRYLWSGFAKARPEPRVHPTQKPLALMAWCLAQVPGDSETVLDLFAGSGTVGVACVARGLSSILVERDPAYFDVACRRIEEAYAQPRLPFPATSQPVQPMLLEV